MRTFKVLGSTLLLSLAIVLAACGNSQVKDLELELEAYKQELTTCDATRAVARDSLAQVRKELAALKAGRAASSLALLDTPLEEAAPKPDTVAGIPSPWGMSWSGIVQGTIDILGETEPENPQENYIQEVQIVDFCFRPNWGRGCHEGQGDLAALANDEAKLRLIGEWVLEQTAKLNVLTGSVARQWLRDYWVASHADMPALWQTVEADPDYLYNASKKLEGRFLRRWMSLGGGTKGDDLVLVYRFWMARMAARLNMPEAATWHKEVRTSIGKCTTLDKAWYLERLDT